MIKSSICSDDTARLPHTPTRSRAPSGASSGEDVEREIPFLKGYTVFNVEQIDGLPDHYYAQPAPRFDPITRIEHPEFFFRATGGDIRCGGGRAFYSPSVPNATVNMLKIAAVATYRPAAPGLACHKV